MIWGTEAHRAQVTHPRSHREPGLEPEVEPRSPEPQSSPLSTRPPCSQCLRPPTATPASSSPPCLGQVMLLSPGSRESHSAARESQGGPKGGADSPRGAPCPQSIPGGWGWLCRALGLEAAGRGALGPGRGWDGEMQHGEWNPAPTPHRPRWVGPRPTLLGRGRLALLLQCGEGPFQEPEEVNAGLGAWALKAYSPPPVQAMGESLACHAPGVQPFPHPQS